MSNGDSILPDGFELAGRYRIRKELGRGGMGVVYEAAHLSLGREVALKTLRPELLSDPEAVERFEREARAAASIGHRGIVQVFDLGTDRGITFLVMERLHGEDLRQRLRRGGALQWTEALDVGIALADAVAAAHQRGIVHRDLSPSNVFLALDDLGHESVKVLDFGVAKLVEASARELNSRSRQTLGTLMYMAPERANGAPDADHRIDVYAIGALLYEALAGAPPFAPCGYPELALKIACERPLSLAARARDCPRAVVAIVERAMHKQPELRWRSARELADRLAALRTGELDPDRRAPPPQTVDVCAVRPVAPPTPARPRVRTSVLLGVALLAAALLGVAAASGALPSRPAEAAGVRPTHAERARNETSNESSAAPPAPNQQRERLHVVAVASQPSGAWIEASGVVPCRAPCSLALPADTEVVLRGRLAGHRETERRVRPPLPSRIELRFPPRPASQNRVERTLGELPPLLPRR